jgi:hypothetical protein
MCIVFVLRNRVTKRNPAMVVKGGYRKIMVKWSEKTISRNENKIPKNITKN